MNFPVSPKKSLATPMIPLIDILAILLIFFIITTTFKTKKHIINIALPTTEALETRVDQQKRVTLALKENGEIYLDDKSIAMKQLATTLKNYKREHPLTQWELKADKKVSLEILIKVWDALKQAGIPIKDVPAQILKS